jgi:hypothetical protein
MRFESVYLYYVLLILCCTHAFAKGGSPERIGVSILAIGSMLSWALVSTGPSGFRSVQSGVLIVDLVVTIAYAALAWRADRFWPIWVTALVGVGALGHLGRWLAGPEISPRVYAISITIWSYVIIAVLMLGTWRHQRRVARFGYDRSWTPSGASAQADGAACT